MSCARHTLQRLAASAAALVCAAAIFSACEVIDDERIPAMPVYIDLGNTGLWNTYGVAGFGDTQYFVNITGSPKEPAGFPYKETSATGFGGILLIGGIDPFTSDTDTPLAYDLACPVEKSREVRVYVDPDNKYRAICPVCASEYDVTGGVGAPMAGKAAELKYGLKRYSCVPTTLGGYYITNLR